MTRRFAAVAIATAALVPATALASFASSQKTVVPTRAEHAEIVKAFGDPAAAAPCLITRLAAANHSYADVRFNGRKTCLEWAFNGVNILERVNATRWRIRFEGSAYKCPIANIPRAVQRDLGVCPYGA